MAFAPNLMICSLSVGTTRNSLAHLPRILSSSHSARCLAMENVSERIFVALSKDNITTGVAMQARKHAFGRLTVLMGVCAVVAACSGIGSAGGMAQMTVLETSRDERPAWIGTGECPQGRMCVVASKERATTVEFGRTDATMNGMTEFARKLESAIFTRFEQARVEGRLPNLGEDPEMDTRIEDFTKAESKSRFQNTKTEDFWWRRYAYPGTDGQARVYIDFYVLLSVPETYWNQKVKEAMSGMQKRAREAGQQKLADELDKMQIDF